MKEIKSKAPVTEVFTFRVEMIVQVFAESENMAKEKLDKEGGYITTRETELLDSVVLHNELKRG